MAMLLDFVGDTDAAGRINKAVEALAADTHGSTTEVGDAIAERL